MVEVSLNNGEGRQLSILAVPDTRSLSGTDVVHDAKIAKQQALERYLDRANKDPVPHIETYNPGRRNTKYYRLTFRQGKKVKRIHIKGGSTISKLANYRAKILQAMIDRGAEFEEILAQLATFNGGSDNAND